MTGLQHIKALTQAIQTIQEGKSTGLPVQSFTVKMITVEISTGSAHVIVEQRKFHSF